jgi:biopolymer transport protein ExbD
MPLLSRRLARRIGRPTGHGPVNLNLIPLVDVLTSIVFFGLLTYSGTRALATLTAFDLVQPPAARANGDTSAEPAPLPALTLRIDRAGISIARVGESTERRFRDFSPATLREVNRIITEYGRNATHGAAVSVIPADDLDYDDLIHVLDEVRAAGQTRIALGIRPRA